MKKNYQKQLRRLAAMLLVAMLVPVAAWSQGSYTLNGVRYVYGTVDGVPVAIVSGFTTEFLESSDELSTEIPCNIAPNAEYPMDRYPVRFPSEAAQYYGVFKQDLNKLKTKLVELSIGTGSFNGEVLEVPSKLFATSPKLKKVTIEACNLGEEAFAECLQLDNINFIFTYATTLGNRCFAGCTALETLYVVNGVEIGEGCFEGCTKLTEASFEPCVKIGDDAFSGCDKLSKLTFKNEIDRDGYANYSGFHSDNSYEHYLNINSFHSNTGSGWLPALKELIFEKPFYSNVKCVTRIPTWCFSNTNLTTIQLPSHCPAIGKGAFQSMPDLREITIPATVTEWGENSFATCKNLTKVTFEDGLKIIGDGFMDGCNNTNQTRLEIPGSVEEIGNRAFSDTKFTRVTLNEGLKVIGDRAFHYCDHLKVIDLPESLEEIGGNAFKGTAISELVLPENCLTLGSGCFEECTKLTKVEFPNALKEIPDQMFLGCKKLEEVDFPITLKRIGGFAFCGTGLKKLVFEIKLEEIGASAFSGCINLKEVEFYQVRKIGDYAFSGCKKITNITLPENLEEIGIQAFADDGTGNGLTVLDMRACRKLETIPFNMCLNDKNLESVVFPVGGSIANIGGNAFSGCKKLKNLVLPKMVDFIGPSAFFNNNAENYWALNKDPMPFDEIPEDEENYKYDDYNYPCPFVNMLKDGTHVFTDAILWVPKGTKSKYQKTKGWRLFKEIKEFEEAEAPDPLYPTADPYNLIYNYEGGNVTVCIDPDAGDGYNEEEQCLQLLSDISDLDDDRKWYWDAEDAEKDPEGYAEHCAWMKSRFRGITLRVVGNGKLIIDYEALGVKKMYVRFGDEKKKVYPISGTTPKAEVIEIPFNRPEPIDVFIYPKTYSDHKASKRRRAEDVENEDTENDGMLKLFSVKVGTADDATGIESITTVFDANAPVYDLNGRRVNAKNLKRGVYVRQGKKVVEK